jgi:hypothetical protein
MFSYISVLPGVPVPAKSHAVARVEAKLKPKAASPNKSELAASLHPSKLEPLNPHHILLLKKYFKDVVDGVVRTFKVTWGHVLSRWSAYNKQKDKVMQ